MPLAPIHKTKFKKNMMVLAMVIGFMVLIWAITILKIEQYGVSPR